ncbi:MAG: hypothetical protein XD49_1720 [Caldanaerobacter subterraneus]|jgi:UV DNA damage endonuclease|uniref:Uncharacterized protein n=1 Tax=Caldanaerobacter subterraneus TaxID=911092 RepID=A0A101FDV7_9THEO|nr:hypothetical protein Teth514_1775 [Thermoanaerobacter sp. X514]KUJ90042.1 MAG: hypothetical protein XD37_1751 [Thermoanaerobacter thermocopriae]KUK08229.1 MAG: hypothetical protein XD49_1720 [Caldanaerobacter subterraneus]MDI3501146.1 hypothetical protein [Thermoanaerobacter sp.]KUK35207.1 MAG: hypothetical protein XD65_0454 [Caldanaerobacter subterraneus]
MFKDKLTEISKFIKQNNMRVSMHPGQYTVQYHTKILDSLEVDYSHKIVLHIGGRYNK